MDGVIDHTDDNWGGWGETCATAQPSTVHRIDGRVARALGELPAYRHWRQRPLSRAVREQLAGMDEQTLMSLAAQALVMLERRVPR